MKKIIYAGWLSIILLALAFAVLQGCSNKEQTEDNKTVSSEEVKKENTEVMDAARVQIQTYRDQMETKLMEYGDKIDMLQTKADNLKDDARAKIDQQITAMRNTYADVSDKLEELKYSGSDEWTQLKLGIDSAMKDLGNSYQMVADKLPNKLPDKLPDPMKDLEDMPLNK